jgi:hypothetical protein
VAQFYFLMLLIVVPAPIIWGAMPKADFRYKITLASKGSLTAFQTLLLLKNTKAAYLFYQIILRL